jgi:hypothetical protein
VWHSAAVTTRRGTLSAIAIIVGLFWALRVLTAQDLEEIALTHRAIDYARPSNDAVATLLRRADGLARVRSAGPSGHLRSLLEALNVPLESQILVFSQGSAQSRRIEAGNPRALYFSDSVVVGWVRGGFIEVAAQDSQQGTIFYSAGPDSAGNLSMTRSDHCLSCHNSFRTEMVPGMIEPMHHTRPLERRWGGWYVTGDTGSIRHFGNVDVTQVSNAPDERSAVNLRSVDGVFDNSGYLTPHSDIAALMVFEHQMHLINLLTRIGWETRVAEQDGRSASGQAAMRERIAQLVDYMLFVDEAPFASAVTGTSGYSEAFSARGPTDRRGRSLYQLDLTTRLLRYPFSYMVYSDQFEALPSQAKRAIYERLWAILSGRDTDARYTRLSGADKSAIIEILRDTRPEASSYFKP